MPPLDRIRAVQSRRSRGDQGGDSEVIHLPTGAVMTHFGFGTPVTGDYRIEMVQ